MPNAVFAADAYHVRGLPVMLLVLVASRAPLSIVGPQMKWFYGFWFFFCAGWGALLAEQWPASSRRAAPQVIRAHM